MRKSHDLSMLTPISTLILGQSPELEHNIHLKLKIYVTQEQRSQLSARAVINEMTQTKRFVLGPISTRNIIPVPEGLMWNVTIIGLAFTVFLISILFLTRAFINEGNKSSGDKAPSWVYDLLVICSLFINTTSVTIATVVSRWRRPADNNSIRFSRKNHKNTLEASAPTSMAQRLQQDFEIDYGRRPNLLGKELNLLSIWIEMKAILSVSDHFIKWNC